MFPAWLGSEEVAPDDPAVHYLPAVGSAEPGTGCCRSGERIAGRMNLRRLEAEVLRDAVLSVAGQLDDRQGGPSVPVTENQRENCDWRAFEERRYQDGRRRFRRSQRTAQCLHSGTARLPLNVLATFDQPEMTPNCELRRSFTVVIRFLWFLNACEVVDRSVQLVELLRARQSDTNGRIQELFVCLFSVLPTDEETLSCVEFLDAQRLRSRCHMRKRKPSMQNNVHWPRCARSWWRRIVFVCGLKLGDTAPFR